MSTIVVVIVVLVLLVALLLAAGALYTVRAARRADAAVPAAGRFIDVNGCRLHYVDRGRGPTIVMVHGLTGQLGHFTYALVDALARDFRVIALDRPGSGWSTRPPHASAGLDEQARTVAAFLEALGLERVLLVGHSLGGALSLAVALDHPRRIAGVALIAPLTHDMREVPDAFRGLAIRSRAMRALVVHTIAVPAAMARRDAILAMVFGPDPAPADFATRGGGLHAARPSHLAAGIADLTAIEGTMPAWSARYRAITVPVAGRFGRGDRILDPRAHGEALREACPGATLPMVDGGHMLPVSAPDGVERWLRAFAAERVWPSAGTTAAASGSHAGVANGSQAGAAIGSLAGAASGS